MTSRMLRFVIAISLCASFGVCSAQSAQLRVGHLIDTRSGRVGHDQSILIQNGTIKSIRPFEGRLEGFDFIDLSNTWVMPGMIDCHVHLTCNLDYGTSEIEKLYIKESASLRALRGQHNARLFLENGFTTVKEIGSDDDYVTADIIKAIKNNWMPGPTIIYSGKIISPYGGQTFGLNPKHEGLWKTEFLEADSHDEIVKAIRKNIYYGGTSIKLVSDHYPYYYDQDDIEVAVKEAHKSNLKVTVHVMGGQAARNVILGGAAAIEHGFDLDDELLALMKEKGVFVVGTDLSFENWKAYGLDSVTAKGWEDKVVGRLQRAYKAGVKMAFGSDVIIDLPGKNRVTSGWEILKSWKLAQIPPSYLLKCLTINAAELLGLEKSRGSICQGYKADIVAFKANPLDDIDNLKNVVFVMKDGRVIRSEIQR